MSSATKTSDHTHTRPLRADARRNRERVLAAAREVFAAEGLEAQMEEVARRAGVGVGTVYRHFPTKDALCEALWHDKWERVIALTREAAENPDPWEGLVEMFERGTSMQGEDLAWCEAAGARLGSAAPPGLEAHLDALAEVTTQLLDRAKSEGKLRNDFDFEDVSRIFCATAGVIATYGPEARESFLRVILDGLRPAPAASTSENDRPPARRR